MNYPSLWSAEVEARIREEAHSLDEQETPKEVKFCKKCVVSNQRPRIVFDNDGVCSACRYAELKCGVFTAGGIGWRIDWETRERELRALLDKHRKESGYDVIVPCSGGKDSSFIAHTLKHKYGMHPLCVTWSPFISTDIGRKNLDAFIHSGFDVITATPNGLVHRKLARLAFEYLGDPFQPFVFGQLSWPMWAASRFDVRLVIYGENGEAEYGGDPAANDKPCWDAEDWVRVYTKGIDFHRLWEIGEEIGGLTKDELRESSQFYRLPDFDREWMGGFGPQMEEPPQFHWLGYYLPWHPQSNYYYASEHTGFEANPEGRSEGTYSKYASLDDRLDGFHYYMAYIKFGIGRATSDAAHEIRDGEITREEGVALVKRYDGEFPHRHFGEFKDYLGLDDEQFWRVVDRYRAEKAADSTPSG